MLESGFYSDNLVKMPTPIHSQSQCKTETASLFNDEKTGYLCAYQVPEERKLHSNGRGSQTVGVTAQSKAPDKQIIHRDVKGSIFHLMAGLCMHTSCVEQWQAIKRAFRRKEPFEGKLLFQVHNE